MTDKQIIDRVNVKECKYYCNGKCERYEEFVEADYANYSVRCICEKENDLGTYDICDYQQLKRKEQKYEELKEKYKWFDHYKEQALYNKNLCNEQFNELTRFKKENKKLKKEIKDWQKEVERVQFIGSYGIMDEVKKNTQLKQTLAEIKEIAEPYYTLGSKDSPVAQILLKINECEGENEV